MRILYHSAAPWTSTGYARVTREVAPRLHNAGHEVALQSMSSVREAVLPWHGDDLYYELEEPMDIYPCEPTGHDNALGVTMIEENFDKFGGDLYFSHFDTWTAHARNVIPNMGIDYSSYIIVDHNPVPEEVINQVLGAQEVVVMSKFAQEKLLEEGVPSTYIPHGINENRYYSFDDEFTEDMQIVTEKEEGGERLIDVSEHFIVGMVAANHGDRKNIPNQFRAFKQFIDAVDDDAILYVHSDMNTGAGFDLNRVRKIIGIPDENIIFTRREDYGDVDDDYLNSLYNSFDVFLNCSIGESWGLTITEAQSAGTPCIVTNFSSMPEQLGMDPSSRDYDEKLEEFKMSEYSSYEMAPHGIVVNPKMAIWRNRVSSRQYMAHPADIFSALKRYYDEPSLREEHGQLAEEFVKSHYTWENHVIPEFIDLFDRLEERLL